MHRQTWLGIVVGLLLAMSARAQSQLEIDERTLKTQNPPVPTDGKGLLKFFEDQSLKEGDKARIEEWIKKLGSDIYRDREPAAKELIAKGPAALPFLRSVLPSAPLEMKRRAEKCITDIEARMQTDVISAASRVLASRKEPRGAEVLFNFLPSISTDAFLEEEVLANVGRQAITPEKVEPLLMNALKDPLSFRRLAAVYLIGRRAGSDYRDSLRAMLADEDPRVREKVQQGLYGKRPAQIIEESRSEDDKLLKSKNIELTEAALLNYFRDPKRTLSDNDQKRLRSLVKNLGHSSYAERARAHDAVIKEGPSALAFLKEVEYDINVELSRRARECMDSIRVASNTGVPIAAARAMTRLPHKDGAAAESIRALIAYIPFVEDESVEEEILTCLTLLSLREPKVEPALVKALDDVSPARRAAAAYVLGHVGTKDHVAKVQPLLDHLDPLVRFRAAQGMLAARNKIALPSLINLIGTIPPVYLPKVEETLYRLSDDKGPTETIQAGNPDSRGKAVRAWDKWLKANEANVDLTALNDRESYLGLITVAEYDNQVGNIQGQVWEGARGGAKRFSFSGVLGAMDARTLPNGRVLIAENNANRVTERDSKGTILWEYRTPTNPICVQRLANGNTFIASYNMFIEVRPDKTEVYRVNPGPQYYMFNAYKAKNGHIVAITANNQIIEVKAPQAGGGAVEMVRTVQTNTQGNWCSVEMLPNGNYLVAALSTSTVKEIDKSGTEVWSKNFPGVFRATRLPNGNVLVASMNTREIAEMDRSGNIRWRTTTTGRPWAIHYR